MAHSMSHGGSLNSARSESTQTNSVLFSLALNDRDHNINITYLSQEMLLLNGFVLNNKLLLLFIVQ